jgi:hypothetical protein
LTRKDLASMWVLFSTNAIAFISQRGIIIDPRVHLIS